MNKPLRPMNSYFLFVADYKKQNNIEFKDRKEVQAFSKIISKKWKELDDITKQVFFIFQVDKII